jgi:hypothetical protein
MPDIFATKIPPLFMHYFARLPTRDYRLRGLLKQAKHRCDSFIGQK